MTSKLLTEAKQIVKTLYNTIDKLEFIIEEMEETEEPQQRD